LNAISPSARGWMSSWLMGISPPFSYSIWSVRYPKSGWCTSSISCTALLVTPIFLPMICSPSSVMRRFTMCRDTWYASAMVISGQRVVSGLSV
jgi:hypothetical protein